MDWLVAIDAYCERLTPGFGGEPFNTLTGLAFLVVGVFAYRLAPAREDRLAAAALAGVGIASAAQHAFAVALTLQADIVANLIYLVALGALMLQRLAGQRAALALVAAGAFVALALTIVQSPVVAAALGRGADLFVVLTALILGSALVLRRRHPATALRLVGAALVLAIGLPFRFLDAGLCASWPLGTHGLWHLCNSVASALLLAALRHHAPALAKAGEGR